MLVLGHIKSPFVILRFKSIPPLRAITAFCTHPCLYLPTYVGLCLCNEILVNLSNSKVTVTRKHGRHSIGVQLENYKTAAEFCENALLNSNYFGDSDIRFSLSSRND